MDNIEIGEFSVRNVFVDITAYHKSAEVTNAGQYWVGTISGDISGIARGLDVAVSASFSTEPNANGLTLEIQTRYTNTFSRGVELSLIGEGRLTLPCKDLGDIDITRGSATVTGLKLAGNDLTIDGNVTFKSDCGILFQLTVVGPG